MNITLVQAELHWEDRESNLGMLDTVLDAIGETDLIVLPEMFTTAFSTRSKSLGESMQGPTVQWMKQKAKANDATITGSAIITENGSYFNRMLWVSPDSHISYYDKRHLFRMVGEQEHFQSGTDRVIVELKGWKIMLQICYDLRFPVFARNRYLDGKYEYDLILYVANWPKPRHNAWSGLLRARAMENLAYSVGVNRVGEDGNNLEYSGGSAIIDFMGNPLQEADGRPCVIQADLNKEALMRFREKFPTGMDADSFELMA